MAIIHEGRVRVSGNPSELVGQIDGHVWKKSIAHDEVASYRERFQLISMRLFAGQTLVHVLSPHQPDAGFEPAPPDLEDFYFATIRGFIHPPQGAPVNRQVN